MFRVANIMKWLQLLLLLVGLHLWVAEARWTVRPRYTTTTRTTTVQPDRHQHVHHWPPLIAPKPPQATSSPPDSALPSSSSSESVRLIESFEQRSANGEHEYRYQLSNGDTRYERTYWLPVGKDWMLARRGFYSVPLPNAQYSTVFYRADNHGYHVDTHTLSGKQPLLPRALEVPHDMVDAMKSTPASKRNSISVPERNENAEKPEGNATGTQTQIQTRSQFQSPSLTEAKVQAVVQIQNSHSQKLIQNKAKPSTVAKVDDILATEVGIASVDVGDNDVTVSAAADDDDDMTESQQNTVA